MNKQPIDLQALTDELAPLLAKHGFTAGYLVAETRRPGQRAAAFCGVANGLVDGSEPTEFLVAMSEQTFGIIKSISLIDVTTGRN